MPFAPSVENTAGFTKYMARASTVLSAIHVRLIHASVWLHRNRRDVGPSVAFERQRRIASACTATEGKVDEIPCKFPANREFGSPRDEFLLTASSTGESVARGLFGRRALVSRHRVQSARRRHAGAGPDQMARARQLEDDGRQLIGQLPRPDQPSCQRPRPDSLSRPPAAVARGPVRKPQQACLCQRARDHLP
jgi:hypothetical protein